MGSFVFLGVWVSVGLGVAVAVAIWAQQDRNDCSYVGVGMAGVVAGALWPFIVGGLVAAIAVYGVSWLVGWVAKWLLDACRRSKKERSLGPVQS